MEESMIGRLIRVTRGQVTVSIDVLPDDVLLSIYDYYVGEATDVEGWRTLVHVCRRWRNVVFGSPRRLHLRVAWTNKSHVREKLDVWPRLPIVVSGNCDTIACLENIKAALEHNDRVCQIELMINQQHISRGDVVVALDKPFPALTDLDLSLCPFLYMTSYPELLKSLGASRHLRSLSLGGIGIPQFPALLAFSVDLNSLHLHDIPHYWYLTPDTTATALSGLTGLETLSLRFKSFQTDHQESYHLLPRSVLLSLICFDYEGVSEYLEALVARIDTPVLERLGITFFRQPTFHTTQLLWFLSRIPEMQELDKARMKLANPEVWIEFSSSDLSLSALRLGISSEKPERHFPCLARFLGLPFNILSTLESLYIVACPHLEQYRWDCVENAQWAELFRPFVEVKHLYLSKEVTPHIAPALQELVEKGVTEVFPTLQNVFLEDLLPAGPVYDAIKQFTAARQLSLAL